MAARRGDRTAALPGGRTRPTAIEVTLGERLRWESGDIERRSERNDRQRESERDPACRASRPTRRPPRSPPRGRARSSAAGETNDSTGRKVCQKLRSTGSRSAPRYCRKRSSALSTSWTGSQVPKAPAGPVSLRAPRGARSGRPRGSPDRATSGARALPVSGGSERRSGRSNAANIATSVTAVSLHSSSRPKQIQGGHHRGSGRASSRM